MANELLDFVMSLVRDPDDGIDGSEGSDDLRRRWQKRDDAHA